MHVSNLRKVPVVAYHAAGTDGPPHCSSILLLSDRNHAPVELERSARKSNFPVRGRQERTIEMEDRQQPGQKAHDMIKAGREFLLEQIRVSQQTIDRAQALLKQIEQLRPQDTVKQ